MTTVHIENQVRDYDAWRAAFDRYAAFRATHGVRAYRICRGVADPGVVTVDLDFDGRVEAEAFAAALLKIWATPQSREHLSGHREPLLLECVVAHAPDQTTESGSSV